MTAHFAQITLDPRIRLVSAALAATTWPDAEQQRKRHRAHAHARGTALRVQGAAWHPAVRTLQNLLDRDTPLPAIFAHALSLTWPDLQPGQEPTRLPAAWNEQLRDFLQQTDLEAWWAEEAHHWQQALAELSRVLEGVDFRRFLRPFLGEVTHGLFVMPNLSFPSDTEIGISRRNMLFCLVPPRIAWGENPPWPFDEDPAYILRATVSQFARLLMLAHLRQHAPQIAPAAAQPLPVTPAFAQAHPTWSDQFVALFVSGATALFLEETVGSQEAQAFVLMENRANGLRILPQVIAALRDSRAAYDRGQIEHLSADLARFTEALRAATRTAP